MVRKKKSVTTSFWKKGARAATLAVCSLALSGMLISLSNAAEFELSQDSLLSIKTTLNYGINIRTTKPDSHLMASINSNDGDQNFDEWSLTLNKASVSTEVDYKFKNLSFHTYVYGFYDTIYNADNDNGSPSTNNNYVGGRIGAPDEWDDDVRELHGRSLDIRDLFVSGDFRVLDRNLMVRVGNQVVTWGESLATFGAIGNAMSYADFTMVNSPGYESKDVYLPSGQVLVQADLVEDFSTAAFYQWEWKKNVFDAAGSFFSTSDIYDKGGHFMLAGPDQVLYTRVHDDEPPQDGQWGVNLTYLARALNFTEFMVCYINYHEKMPMVLTDAASRTYRLKFAEDVELYGFSFGTTIGGTNIGGEIAYRKDLPVSIKGGYAEHDVVQYLISIYHSIGPIGFIDQTLILAEGGYNQVLDPEKLTNDTSAMGYLLKATFKFNNLFPRVDLSVPVTWRHRPKGKSSLPATWTERTNEAAIGLDFSYNLNLMFGIGYTEFLGDYLDYAKSDRDYINAYVKYSF